MEDIIAFLNHLNAIQVHALCRIVDRIVAVEIDHQVDDLSFELGKIGGDLDPVVVLERLKSALVPHIVERTGLIDDQNVKVVRLEDLIVLLHRNKRVCLEQGRLAFIQCDGWSNRISGYRIRIVSFTVRKRRNLSLAPGRPSRSRGSEHLHKSGCPKHATEPQLPHPQRSWKQPGPSWGSPH